MKNNYYLAKHDDFVVANYDFNFDTQRLFFACLYKMNSNYVKPIINELSYIYKLDFEEIKNISGIDYDFENSKERVERAKRDLTSKIVKIKVKNGYVITGVVKSFRLDNVEKIVTVEIDKEIKPFLVETFRKFTKFGFKHLSLCQSKYTFRLYEILITKTKNINDDRKIIKISVDELRETLTIPKTQGYGLFKERVIEKANIEFNALDIEKIEEREEKQLFKSFSYQEVVTRKRGRGRNPVTDIIFEFELLDETKALMMSKVEKIEIELDSEDWIFTELRLLMDANSEREPYFKTLEINYIYSYIVQSIENIKIEYTILGNLNQIIIKKTLDNAFSKFKKYKNNSFEEFLLNGFRKNCDFQMEKGKSLQAE